MAVEPTDMGGAPIDLENLGLAARAWLSAKADLDIASSNVDAAKECQGDARAALMNADKALIDAAELTTDTRTTRRICVPSGSMAQLVVVDHDGAEAVAVLVCPEGE